MSIKKLRPEIHAKYDGRCAYCGEEITIKNMQVDHAIPKFFYNPSHHCLVVHGVKFTEYGPDDIKNLMPACRVCNNWKRTWTLDEFRHEIEMQIERLRKYSAPFRLAERYGLTKEGNRAVIFYFEVKHDLP